MNRFKLLRLLNDYLQINVEMKTGISQATLSTYETGKTLPTADNLIILAKLYNTSVDYLLDLTDEQKPYPRKK